MANFCTVEQATTTTRTPHPSLKDYETSMYDSAENYLENLSQNSNYLSKSLKLNLPALEALEHFKMVNKPTISFRDYLQRFRELGKISSIDVISSLVLLKRVHGKGLTNRRTIFKQFLTCLYISTKFNNDLDFWNLTTFAALAGIKAANLEKYERVMLCDLLEWDTMVSLEDVFDIV